MVVNLVEWVLLVLGCGGNGGGRKRMGLAGCGSHEGGSKACDIGCACARYWG